MSFLSATSPFAGALAWALVHSLWQASAVALALEAVLAAMPAGIGWGRARHRAAAAALGVCALAPVLTLAWLLASRPGGGSAAAAGAMLSAGGILRAGGAAAAGAMLGVRAVALVSAVLPWLLPAWAAAAALALLRLTGGAFLARRLVARSRPAPAVVSERARALADRLGIRRRVRVVVTERAASPAAIGGVRPTLLLPARSLEALSAAELDAVLVHELMHLARYDDVVALLQGLIDALLVLSPAAWHVSRRLRAEREHRCDDAVVAAAGRVRYTRTLLSLDELRAGAPARAAGLAAADGPLVRRIRRLAAPPPRRPAFALAAALALVALVPVGERLLAASAGAIPRGQRTIIRAVDDAGPFTVAVLDGRVVGATLDGHDVPTARLRVAGDSLHFLDRRGGVALSVRLLPNGTGLSWSSRPRR